MTWVTAEVGTCALAVVPVLPDEQLFQKLLNAQYRRGESRRSIGPQLGLAGQEWNKRNMSPGNTSIPRAELSCM